MKHLVIGGTGTVGSAVVRGLLAKNEGVRVMTRSDSKSQSLPSGATGVVGDLLEPATFSQVFSNYDNLFLLNAVSPSELQEGLNALAAAKNSGVKRIVYLSVHDVEKGVHVPHFAAKIAMERAIEESGVPFTILRPNNFFQNDYWFKDALLQYGVYPQPFGDKGVSRVDIRDIGEAAVNALTLDGHANKTYALVGPKPMNGAATAEVWASVLGKPIQYGGNDLEAWGQQAGAMMPAWMVFDMKLMYGVFQDQGLVATDAQLAETKKIVGHDPIPFEQFAKETAESWK